MIFIAATELNSENGYHKRVSVNEGEAQVFIQRRANIRAACVDTCVCVHRCSAQVSAHMVLMLLGVFSFYRW